MKKYSHPGRTFVLLSASLLLVPLSFGQTPAETTATPPAAAPQAPAPEKKIPVETVKPDDKALEVEDEQTLVLSPFEVQADNKGYYSANTMSGTRFKTRLEDLG